MIKTTIKNETGLHARPASKLVAKANEFGCEVSLIKNGESYNCKSIMGIMSSGLVMGDEIEIVALGDGAKEAEKAIFDIIDNLED